MFLPKEIPKLKISNRKKSFDHPCHLKSGVPHPKRMLFLQKSPKNYCGNCSLMKFVLISPLSLFRSIFCIVARGIK